LFEVADTDNDGKVN